MFQKNILLPNSVPVRFLDVYSKCGRPKSENSCIFIFTELSCLCTAEEEMMRQVIVYPGEDGYYVAECPSLPGCISQGKSKEEAITSIKEAIEEYELVLREDNLPVPSENFDSMMVVV